MSVAPVVIGHKPTTHAANSVPHVYQAICAVTAALAKEGISKDRKNQQQGYAFRGIEDVQNALAPLLAIHQLCMLPVVLERTCVERQTKSGGTLFYVTVKVRFDLVSAQDGSSHSVETYGEAMDSADKATNKALSAAAKYACILGFCIPTEGAEDADYHTPEPVAPKSTQAVQAVRDHAADLHKKAVTMPAPTNKEGLRDRVDRVISTVAMLDNLERVNKAFARSQELREELFLQGCEDMSKMLEEAFEAARSRVTPPPDEVPF